MSADVGPPKAIPQILLRPQLCAKPADTASSPSVTAFTDPRHYGLHLVTEADRPHQLSLFERFHHFVEHVEEALHLKPPAKQRKARSRRA